MCFSLRYQKPRKAIFKAINNKAPSESRSVKEILGKGMFFGGDWRKAAFRAKVKSARLLDEDIGESRKKTPSHVREEVSQEEIRTRLSESQKSEIARL